MLFYLAPMEGITGYIVRNAYAVSYTHLTLPTTSRV